MPHQLKVAIIITAAATITRILLQNSQPNFFHCLATYANWGDLAKLSCVQKSWSNIVMDTANQSLSSQWELAMALLNGDCGLVYKNSLGILVTHLF